MHTDKIHQIVLYVAIPSPPIPVFYSSLYYIPHSTLSSLMPLHPSSFFPHYLHHAHTLFLHYSFSRCTFHSIFLFSPFLYYPLFSSCCHLVFLLFTLCSCLFSYSPTFLFLPSFLLDFHLSFPIILLRIFPKRKRPWTNIAVIQSLL